MFIKNLSWTVRNSIKKHGCSVIWTRYTGNCEKWANLSNKKLPAHYASFVQFAEEDNLSSLNLSLLRRNEDSILSNPLGKDSRQFYSIKDTKILPSLINNSMYAAKKKGKGRDSKQADKDSDKEDEDDDGDDDDDDDDDLVPVDYKDLDIETGNLRLDSVMKTAVPMTRKRIEEVHAEDKIRVNGERVPKRSVDVTEGDIIDVIYGRNRENSKLLDVRRVKLLSVPEYKTAKDRVKFKIRRWNSLTIENYVIHPFESMVIREEDEIDGKSIA